MLSFRRLLVCGALGVATTAGAQEPARPATPAAPATTDQQNPDSAVRFHLPTITVTAQKESEDIQESPVSVTAVTADTLDESGARSVSEASQFAPNTFFSEFTARKLSNPRFRGIGSSPNNPGVTTYIDGVPQLNANSSSIEFLEIDQIEFVRGPQSALFGRNTLGGLVNITSARPSLAKWTGSVIAPFGNYNTADMRATASGPVIADKLAVSFGAGYSGREGFTINDITGHDLDSRSAFFGKAQVLWTPNADWQIRGIMSGERARDGDYALYDLQALRDNPFHAARDFEGYTHRDIVSPTLLVSHAGKTIDLFSTTGFVWWKTTDLTDLDYTPLPLITRDNGERDLQFTQEFRVSPAKNAARALSKDVTLRWQAGLFLFTQGYTQQAVNSFAPSVLSPQLPFPVDQHSPDASLDDKGIGVYGQGTLTFGSRFDATVAVRGDHESKTAALNTFFVPAVAPANTVNADNSFNDVSPQFTGTYHVSHRNIVYGTASRGFKAGGFNAAAPPGGEGYGPEHSWNFEGGVKSSWLEDRLTANAAVFYMRWADLQVNVPNPFVPAQFYIANAGKATSKGVEFEVTARPMQGLEVFGGVGTTNARFGSGSMSGGVDVSGNKLSNAPGFTADAGVQYSRLVSRAVTAYGRADLASYGSFQYDDANTRQQDAYSLTNFRGGVRSGRVFVEGWIRNAFNTAYILTAFAYPGLAPSGFIGENGPARTFGVRAGVTL